MTGERRRESFDDAAADYGRYRAPYPDEVVADVLHGSGIHAGTRVLEIGCGSGQLSVPVARAGAELVAVELGASLAAIAYPELDTQPQFRSVRRHRFEIPRQHTTESYVGWLRTDSLILSLDDQARAGFLNDIATKLQPANFTTLIKPGRMPDRASSLTRIPRR